jgi:hypothetical protein
MGDTKTLSSSTAAAVVAASLAMVMSTSARFQIMPVWGPYF